MTAWERLSVWEKVSVGFDASRKGTMGFLVELPGAFVRGNTEEEALAKVDSEVKAYLKWLGLKPLHNRYRGTAVQRHLCLLMVEDADSEILLDADRGPMDKDEFELMVNLVSHSGEAFESLFLKAEFKDWTDNSKLRRTFHGRCPATIRETYEHVNATQLYYASRAGIKIVKGSDFMRVRESCLSGIGRLFCGNGNSRIYEVNAELWTLKKILRRFVWHDRIHGKATVRMLAKQKALGMIENYDDPYRFGI